MMRVKQKWLPIRAAFIAIFTLAAGGCFAQALMRDIPVNRPLILVEEQYEQGHYALAAQSARSYLDAPPEKVFGVQPGEREKAQYYLALSGLKADLPGCVDDALATITTVNSPAYKQRISFTLAQYYFHHEKWAKAIPLYESASISNQDNTEIADSKFELAYCYFNNRQFDKAAPLLLYIKEIKDGKYYTAGNYYYGLLVYNENKYKEALKSFDRIKDEKEYRAIVPYYIAEIYYFMGLRARALQQADTILARKEKSFYENELHLLAAQCLFEEQRYPEARPHFEFYYDHSTKIRKEDLYEMAYCDYRTSEWEKAIEKFKMLSDANDSLGQTAMYLLGDSYLKTNDLQSARNAFGICADMAYNPGQQEASMIVYSKISYDLGYNDEALRQLNNLLKTYPRTQYKDEANTLVSGLYLKTNNYTDALRYLEKVTVKDEYYRQLFQKATFGYAVKQYRDGDLNNSLKYFNLSTKYAVSAEYAAAACFWKGEIAWHLHNYQDVVNYSDEFINRKSNKAIIQQISPLATVQHAYLNMGFAAMDAKNYAAAQGYFARAQEAGGDDVYAGTVASLREADAVFMQKSYSKALTLYEKIIARDTLETDYAIYQKGILLGLLGKATEKVAALQSLVYRKPPSGYANNARYEIAVTYMDADKYPQALMYLRQLADSVKDKSFAPRAWMKIGFISQQMGEPEKAIIAYKHVVLDYPAAEDRLPAMDALRNLYIQTNQPAAYSRMLRDNKLPSADSSSVDSTYYAAAEAQFEDHKWQEASDGFDNYLRQYPTGIFAMRAHYYRAESNYQLKKYKETLPDYDFILNGKWNDFYENSSVRASGIAFASKDYKAAFSYYSKLNGSATTKQTKELAYSGLMRSAYNLNMVAESGLYADSLTNIPGISSENNNDALYFKAKSLQLADNKEDAIAVYRQLSHNKNGDMAAESRYRIAELLMKEDNLKEAEDAANETIKLSAGYDYWIVKSYILLSDILVKEKDYFNAKGALEGVVKHTKITELKQEAAKKLDEVKALEKQKSKLSDKQN